MAEQKCIECGKQYYTFERICPHCGNPKRFADLLRDGPKVYSLGGMGAVKEIVIWGVYAGVLLTLGFLVLGNPEYRWLLLPIGVALGFVGFQVGTTAYRVELFQDRVICRSLSGRKEFPFTSIGARATGGSWIAYTTTVGKLKFMCFTDYDELYGYLDVQTSKNAGAR